jgi:cystathionine gamma-synthase
MMLGRTSSGIARKLVPSAVSTSSRTSRNVRLLASQKCTFASLPNADAFDYEKILKSELPYESKPLGSPLPFDEHACSVSLPTWSSVVGYEEGDESVTGAMTCGYPRFVYHPYVLQVAQFFLDTYSDGGEDCLVLPSKEAALRCQSFLQQALEGDTATTDVALLERPENTATLPSQGSSKIRVESFENAKIHAVIFPAKTEAGTAAKAYWQHTGELVSSRRASRALSILGHAHEQRVTCCPKEGTPTIFHGCEEEANPQSPSDSPLVQLQERIAGWTNVSTDNIFLLPSGMASIYKALRSARRYQLEKNPASKGGSSIVFGFPYLDTLKMCSRTELSPGGVEFFGKGDAKDLDNLERILAERPNHRWSGLFTEVPSNPLLQCPDLERLRELADEHDFCLVVDDTSEYLGQLLSKNVQTSRVVAHYYFLFLFALYRKLATF